MWQQKYSCSFEGVTPEQVWQAWSDVSRYCDWHDDLDYCQLQGEFVVGNFFRLKPKGAPTFKVHITELQPYHLFVDETRFLGATMMDKHICEAMPDGVTLTSVIEVTGPLTPLWAKLVAKNVAASVPKEMQSMINWINKQHA